MFPTKVLLATDGSEDAALAARAAVDAAGDAELHVVHVWHFIPTAHLRSFVWAGLERLGGELLEEQVERLERAGARISGVHLVEGRAADAILELAERLGADFLVVGSRGLGRIDRIVLGSVSEGMVHHARCPVLVLRGGEESWPPRRVVFADDGSAPARAAGDLAAKICFRHRSQGLLVHAYPELPEVDAEGRAFDPRIIDDELHEQERILQKRAKELEPILGSRPEIRVSVGDATTRVLKAAEEETPEKTLLAVGSRGLGPVGRMRLGSVSTKVLRLAKGPVLVHPHAQT